MKKLGFIGQRGMVGSVLLQRMQDEKDFNQVKTYFFSTSQPGLAAPQVPNLGSEQLWDAHNLEQLSSMDVLLSCQGGDYTKLIYPQLMQKGWKGYWIDAASALRMDEDSVLVLDPVNHEVIQKALQRGIKKYIGANCTVSLMLMAINGLIKANLVEWVSSMTYQAASGAGAQNMRELLEQMHFLGELTQKLRQDPSQSILEIDALVTSSFQSQNFPLKTFGYPLAGSLLPWIDVGVEEGQSREEWKGMVEANKILNLSESMQNSGEGSGSGSDSDEDSVQTPIRVDGTCVRVGAMRCHSQGLTIKLKRDLPLLEIENLIRGGNSWVKFIPNTKEATLQHLVPAAVSGKLHIPIGRVRKMKLGPEYINAFTVGDQLLWGAAEPLRRVLLMILQF